MENVEDLLQNNTTNNKPPIGVSSDGQNLYRYDENGNIIENRNFGGSGLWKSQHPYESDPEKARVGDYYYDQSGNLQVVPNSPTDIFNKWKITDDISLSVKPKKSDFMSMDAALLPGVSTGGSAVGAVISKSLGKGLGAGGAAGLMVGAAIGAIVSRQQVAMQEQAYKDALKQWQEAQDKAKWDLAGSLRVEDDGSIYFTPDPSKAISMNTAFSGTEIQKAFDKETKVHLGDDGRLKIDVNPIYAAAQDYTDRLEKVKEAFSGLTKDSENLEESLDTIRKYIEDGNNQFKFREQSMYSYKRQIPDAANSDIENAAFNEIGAYMSENDGADYKVTMYRDGKLEETNAKDVLESFYKKDLGKRSDYMLDLYAKMEDPNISSKDKVYILSEIKLLNAADSNENTYDNGAKNEKGEVVKTKNKYFGMLDQESIISTLNNWNLIGGVNMIDVINALDQITPWNMHISDQKGLQEDPAAASAARIISTATSAMTSYFAMQKIEYGIVRPVAGKIGESITNATSKFMENLAAKGGRLADFVGRMQLLSGGLEYSAEAGNMLAKWVEGARVAASPFLHALGYSMGELLYNATSDLLFDVTKVGIENLAGDETPWGDFAQDFGTDLVMDLVMQYGPAGMASLRMELDNARVDAAFAPYKENLNIAMSKFDAAEIDYNATKEAFGRMRKGSKRYEATKKELAKKKRAYESTKKEYEKIREAANTAVKEAMPTRSEEFGAALAFKIANMEKNDVIMWLRKHFTDDNAALSTVAAQAYGKTKDVYLYAAAINKFQTVQSVINEVAVKMNYMDSYAKGTANAYKEFKNAVEAAAPGAKFSKAQIEYMVAKSEYELWSRQDVSDEELAKIQEKYQPYIDKVQGEERQQLDVLLEKTKAYLMKVGESYVKSGAATKKQMQDIVEASLGDGYIPLWGKNDNNNNRIGIFEAPLTMKVGRKFDPSDGRYSVENMRNPIDSAAAYVNAVMNNIARNEMAAMLKDIASIDGISIQLSENGSKNVSEFDDAIQKALIEYTNKRKKTLDGTVSSEKYHNGLKRLLDATDNYNSIKEIDELIPQQKKLQRLVEINNAETDPVKKAARLVRIANLEARIKAQKVQIRNDIDTRVRAAGEYFNKVYKKYGIKVDVENTLTSSKYTDLIDSRLNSMSPESLIKLKGDIEKTINKIAPYLPVEKIDSKSLESTIKGLRIHVTNKLKKEHPELTRQEVIKRVNKATADFKAIINGDLKEEVETPEGYKIHYMSGNKDASFYIKGDLAKEVAAEMNSKSIVDRRKVYSFFKEAANIKRLLTTGIDPTRVLPNLVRDTIRNGIMSGGTDFWFFDNSPFGFQQMFTKMAKAMGDSDEQIALALNTLRASQEIASGSTFNEALSGRRTNRIKRLVETSDAVGKNRGTKFIWEMAHDKRKLLESPMNWAEGLTRDRAAASAFMRAYMRGGAGLDFDTRLNNAYEAGINAGRENTVNFTRRGTFIKEISAFVPYLSQRFSSIESTKIAFLKDPVGVSTRLMMFGAAYMIELSRVLADEETRKSYYNLSEYDRENNIILSMGEGDLVTIPLDETIAAIIYPWRRGIETLHNVDPENFYMIMVNGFLQLSPFDLSGFTEGDSFNFGRGVEKLGAQVLPTLVQAGYSQLTGRNMYYGSDVSVTKDSLAQYGNYTPTAGDYTTTGKNSQVLRGISDAFGIEQWRLQQVVADLGGNVGQYVVNWLDKISGAPEDAQGGKDFVDATFKSFTGMDSTQVQYAFNDGIAKLEEEKTKILGRLNDLNNKISLASGEKLAELQGEYKKVKQDFAMKVGNFVDKYVNAYEIAGGLTKYQANRIWYLFNFSDDNTMSMEKSAEAYYRDQAQRQASQDATLYSSSILDKYYDQTKNVYKGDDGKFHYYSPYGEQAFFNTINGKGLEYQMGLRNILDNDDDMNALKSQVYEAREKAANAKNWDEYDRLGLAFDEKVLAKIAPYIEKVGAKNAMGENKVLEYLEDWFFVPTSYMKTKYGKNLSLAHNASKQKAFKTPYIKELFGVSTAYSGSSYVERPDRLVGGQ